MSSYPDDEADHFNVLQASVQGTNLSLMIIAQAPYINLGPESAF
jgi:hypothetical protein